MEEMEEGGKEEGRNFHEALNIVKKKGGFSPMFWGKTGIEEVPVKNTSNSSCLM